MKRTACVAILTILVLSSALATFAQSSRTIASTSTLNQNAFAQFERIEALTGGDGVLVRWQMRSETRNLGFYLYRNDGGEPRLVNEGLYAGAAIRKRGDTVTDEQYELFDVDGALGSTYYLEAVSTDGRRIATLPVGVEYVENFASITNWSRAAVEAARINGNIRRDEPEMTQELKTLVNTNLQAPDLQNHQWVVGQPGVKIGIKVDGIYRVTRTELQNAGFDLSGSSANWRLFLEGNEQAINVGPADEYIEFYARGLDTPESDTRIYNLIADAATPGKRMTTKVLRPVGGNVVTSSYRVSAHYKERTTYIAQVINGTEENYFGRIISSNVPTAGNEIQFTVTGADLSVPRCSIVLRLIGQVGQSHRVKARINGHDVGYISGGGVYSSYRQELLVPTSFLVEGVNRLSMTEATVGPSSLFESLTVRYSRKYQANQGHVAFSTPGYRKLDVAGFETSDIRLLDTTFDGSPVQVDISNRIIPNGDGTFRVEIPATRPMLMYGFTPVAIRQSPSISPNTPSTLSDPTNVADLVILSYSSPDMMAAAEAWANYRRNRSGGTLNVKVVDVEDVYDEFNFGIAGSLAINNFVKFATQEWATAPGYLLLVGDASYDPRNYEGTGNWNQIPTKMVGLIFEESGSDEALGDNLEPHDGLAEIAIGRIPFRTGPAVLSALNKTMAYEVPSLQTLSRGALFVYDLPRDFDFEAMSLDLAGQLPPGTPIQMLGRGLPFPQQLVIDPNGHDNLMAAINSGKYVVNFSGHGAAGVWGATAFFNINHVPSLTNGSQQSIFTMLTCFNGLFFRPTFDSLGESLLAANNGGGVAAWASSTETVPTYQLIMGQRFYQQIGLGNIKRMGDLVRDAKSVIAGSDVGYSWVLLGDPMLQVRPETQPSRKPVQFSAQ